MFDVVGPSLNLHSKNLFGNAIHLPKHLLLTAATKEKLCLKYSTLLSQWGKKKKLTWPLVNYSKLVNFQILGCIVAQIHTLRYVEAQIPKVELEISQLRATSSVLLVAIAQRWISFIILVKFIQISNKNKHFLISRMHSQNIAVAHEFVLIYGYLVWLNQQ